MKINHRILAIVWFILGSILGLILTYVLHQRLDLANTLFWTVPLVLGPQIGIFVGEAKRRNPFWTAIYGLLLGIIILIVVIAVAIWLSANEKMGP